MNDTLHDYLQLNEKNRIGMRIDIHDQLTRTKKLYADFLAAEAVMVVRKVEPSAARLAFSISDIDPLGISVTLLAVYDAAGNQLWDWDFAENEWPDESEVTDLLGSAAETNTAHFRYIDGAYQYALPV